MKIIYKLPQYLAGGVCIWIAVIIYNYIKLANASDFFEMLKYQGRIKVPIETILGVDAYLILMMIGLFFAIVLAVLRRNLLNIKPWVAVLIAVVFFLQAYLGAKVLSGIEHVITDGTWDSFNMNGQSLYGTIPITFSYVLVLAIVIKRNYLQLLDYVAPLWLTLLIFVRIGCFTVGCCGADECTVAGIDMVIPVQLFEVALDLIALQIILNIEKKQNRKGNLFFIMIGLYGFYRFFLEFMRSTEIILLGLTFGQIYSAICIAIAIVCIEITKNNKKIPLMIYKESKEKIKS